MMSLRIKTSKTDPFRHDATVGIAATFDKLCPVGAMRNYLALHDSHNRLLFNFLDGKFLTRKNIHALLVISLPTESDLNTHSFRIGGASVALSAGASDSHNGKMV